MKKTLQNDTKETDNQQDCLMRRSISAVLQFIKDAI